MKNLFVFFTLYSMPQGVKKSVPQKTHATRIAKAAKKAANAGKLTPNDLATQNPPQNHARIEGEGIEGAEMRLKKLKFFHSWQFHC